MIRNAMFALGSLALVAATPALAAPCKDAKGKFIKCPAKPAAATRCKLDGKFAKCGTPGAKADVAGASGLAGANPEVATAGGDAAQPQRPTAWRYSPSRSLNPNPARIRWRTRPGSQRVTKASRKAVLPT